MNRYVGQSTLIKQSRPTTQQTAHGKTKAQSFFDQPGPTGRFNEPMQPQHAKRPTQPRGHEARKPKEPPQAESTNTVDEAVVLKALKFEILKALQYWHDSHTSNSSMTEQELRDFYLRAAEITQVHRPGEPIVMSDAALTTANLQRLVNQPQ